ncbi:MAG: DUF5060 domain-containing protein, partial [Flavobacteriaceae bacterium]
MKSIKTFISKMIFVLMALSIFCCSQKSEPRIDGELKKWHRVTLNFEGPETSELAEENPFLDYRLDVVFTNGDKTYTVPGFYAADGNAAETSATSGNIWQVRFTPDATGEWK